MWSPAHGDELSACTLAYRPHGARVRPTPQVADTGSYPMEWTSDGRIRSNLEGGSNPGEQVSGTEALYTTALSDG